MTHLVLDDALLDAQTLRAAGAAPYGGADLGEILATARRIKSTDLGSWYDEWTALAEGTLGAAETAERQGATETARLSYLRACTYFRTAGTMLLGPPLDDRLVESNRRQTDAFRRAAGLLARPAEVLAIPYEDTTLPGYFLSAGDGRRATVVLTGGYDGTCEELYFFNGAAALARGHHVLMFDGPGQGAALLQQGLVIRADWEHVVTPALDFLLQRPDVDPQRVALIGLSLGANLAPRAASAEHRLAACIADCGAYDMYAAFLARMPDDVRARFDAGDAETTAAVGHMLDQVMQQPTAGWALRRGLLVHGVPDALTLVRRFRDFSLAGHAEHITCPTFVCNAEDDDISASAPQLAAALTCPKEFVTFTAAEGAGDHCESGARTLYHARSFGWLDALLHPRD